MGEYIFDNAAEVETGQRFDGLAALHDDSTTRVLEATGVGPGWCCLEVGGGNGSIGAWLADRAGSTGSVTVTDIDPRFLERSVTLRRSTVTIQRHDIGADPLPERGFDLIHARLVLIHVPTRRQALARMVGALRPGGWLVVEDYDPTLLFWPTTIAEPVHAERCGRLMMAQRHLLAARGAEDGWGRNLVVRFREHGLVEVGMEGRVIAWTGGSIQARVMQANFTQTRAEAVAAGLVIDRQVDEALVALDDPDLSALSPIMLSAWGRRPTERGRGVPGTPR